MLRRTLGESKAIPRNPTTETELPPDLCCPLTYEPFVDPVLNNDGRIYEREAIGKCKVSPFTRQRIELIHVPALSEHIKSIIQEWKNKNREWHDYVEHLKKESEELESEIKALRGNLQALEHKELLFPPNALTQSRNQSLFLEAIREGNISSVRYYARQGVSIDARDKDSGATALMIAIALRDTHPMAAKDIIMMLCDELRVDVNLKNASGCTALHIAAGNNDAWTVNFLLNKFANPLFKNNFGDIPRQFGRKINGETFNRSIISQLHEAEFNCQCSNPSALFSSRTLPKRAELTSEQKNHFNYPVSL